MHYPNSSSLFLPITIHEIWKNQGAAGIPIIFMTSLIRASLSSTKLFIIRVKGQMKTKTSMMRWFWLTVSGMISSRSLQYLFCWDVFFVLDAKKLSWESNRRHFTHPNRTPAEKKISLVLAKGTKKRPKTLFTKVAKGSCVYAGVGKGISRTLTGSKPPERHGSWKERGGFEDKNHRFLNEQFPWLNLNFRRV